MNISEYLEHKHVKHNYINTTHNSNTTLAGEHKTSSQILYDLISSISNIILPHFDTCCQKYTIEYDKQNAKSMIIKGKTSDFQFNGLAIIVKKLGAKKDEFVKDFLTLCVNNPIFDFQLANMLVFIEIKSNVIFDHFKLLAVPTKLSNPNPKKILIEDTFCITLLHLK
jgi:hypothetical protein